MNKFFKTLIAGSVLAAALAFTTGAQAYQTPPPAKPPVKTSQKPAPTPPPTAQQIADAQAQHLVWVNLSTKVFHKDGEFYGKTKQGKFMTEADALKAGYRAAKEPASKKTPAPPKK